MLISQVCFSSISIISAKQICIIVIRRGYVPFRTLLVTDVFIILSTDHHADVERSTALCCCIDWHLYYTTKDCSVLFISRLQCSSTNTSFFSVNTIFIILIPLTPWIHESLLYYIMSTTLCDHHPSILRLILSRLDR
jgi:hypothetical protein